MAEWATYTLADFLMFSPRVYFRLVERYNQGLWPFQLVFIAGALAVLFATATATDGRRARAAAMATLSVAWFFCAWQFLWLRYSTINWAMSYGTAAFMLQSGLLLLAILWTDRAALPANSLRRRGGIGPMVFGLLAYPFLPLIAGRAPASAESFGTMPDPTAAVTLGALVAFLSQKLWLLLPIPLLWCAFSALTLLAMEDFGAWAPFVVILTTFALLLVRR